MNFHSNTGITLFESLTFEPSTAIAFEIFEISDLTKFWTLRAFEGFESMELSKRCLAFDSDFEAFKASTQLGAFKSFECSELTNIR